MNKYLFRLFLVLAVLFIIIPLFFIIWAYASGQLHSIFPFSGYMWRFNPGVVFYFLGVFPTLASVGGVLLVQKFSSEKTNLFLLLLSPAFAVIFSALFFVLSGGEGGQFGPLFGLIASAIISALADLFIAAVLLGILYVWQKLAE